MARSLARNTGFYSTSTVLAVLFLFPMVWTLYSSVHGQQATDGADPDGFGLANYRRLFDYGAGIGSYLVNSLVVSLITVLVTVNPTMRTFPRPEDVAPVEVVVETRGPAAGN